MPLGQFILWIYHNTLIAQQRERKENLFGKSMTGKLPTVEGRWRNIQALPEWQVLQFLSRDRHTLCTKKLLWHDDRRIGCLLIIYLVVESSWCWSLEATEVLIAQYGIFFFCSLINVSQCRIYNFADPWHDMITSRQKWMSVLEAEIHKTFAFRRIYSF